jgi:DNA-binding LytR/AlgR family response regulator
MNRSAALQAIPAAHVLPGCEWPSNEAPVHPGIGPTRELSMPLVRDNPSIYRTASEIPVSMRQPKIAFRDKKKISFVYVKDIVAIEAEGNYVVLHRAAGSVLLRESIAIVERKLSDYGFMRIHRSVVVNIGHVDSVEVMTDGRCRVYMSDGSQYGITRNFRTNLQRLAAVWLGTRL